MPRALHVEVVGAGKAGRSRLVLVHGFTQTGRSWHPLAARLAAAGHEVVLVDAPGHGGSGAIRAGLWDGARLLGQAGGRAVYVGYSMGARLCLHLALARPELATGLILLGASPGLEDPGERAARRAADEDLAASLDPAPGRAEGGARLDAFLHRWLAQPLFATLGPQAAGLEDRRRNTPTGLASSLRLAGTGCQDPLWDRLPTLTVPTLLVAGDRDQKFVALGRRMAAAIGSRARLVLVADAGHAAHLEQPEAFLRAVVAFVDHDGGGIGSGVDPA